MLCMVGGGGGGGGGKYFGIQSLKSTNFSLKHFVTVYLFNEVEGNGFYDHPVPNLSPQVLQ